MMGFTGASGTGKTTLAMMLARNTGSEFIPSVGREVFADMGYDPSVHYGFDIRMKLQWEILSRAEKSYKAAKKSFISDRTPLDFMIYTAADVMRGTLSASQADNFLDYQNECFEITNKYFGVVVGVQPGIAVENDGVRPVCPAFSEHINMLMMGALNDERLQAARYYINKDVTDLDIRFKIAKRIKMAISDVIEKQRIQGTTH